ncbi:MAG TPA: glycosyltransferase family 4 protein [Xanthobacteraceae bacterium]|nr:glycosyltransferase family 4 protein [Xanthobacteraceae bacterium]
MTDAPQLRVLIATPFGARQRGGIDRLTDLIIDTLATDCTGRIHAARLVTRGTGTLALSPFIFSWALFRLLVAKARGEVDLLHVNVAAGGSAVRKAILARWARLLGIPYIVHLHGSRFHQFWPTARPSVRRIVDRMFGESAGIIVLGKYWLELVATALPAVRDKISILPNATAPIQGTRLPAADGRVRISFLGELGPRKGTPQLVEALGRLAKYPQWVATLAGNGQIQPTRDRVRELGIEGRVAVPGWLDASRVNEILRSTDILVLPSFAENLPMSILEAFAYGAAVIATPVGAVAEVIVPESNGLLVPAGDVENLTKALLRLIIEDELRASLGAAAKRDHAKHYDIQVYLARLTEIWRTAAHAMTAARQSRPQSRVQV